MKVVFDYTTYFCLLNFLTTLSGLTLQKGWRDLRDNYVTTVLCLPMYSHKMAGLLVFCRRNACNLGLPCETGGNRCGRGTLSILTAGRAQFGVCFLKK